MKLPYQNEDLSKRIMIPPDDDDLAVTVNGNGTNQNGSTNGVSYSVSSRITVDKAVQYDVFMDLGGLPDQNEASPLSPPVREVEMTVASDWSASGLNETVPVSSLPSHDIIKPWPKEMETSEPEKQQQQQPPVDDGPRYKLNNNNNPPSEDTSDNSRTLRLRSRNSQSSGSEDEIEKLSESILQMSGGDDHLEKPAKEEKTSHSEGAPGAAKRSDRGERDEEDSECVIQCLSYTLQCCECVIS